MSENLKALVARIDNQDNAIGVLLTDTLFAQKLRGTMDNAQAASIKLDENLIALRHNFLFRRYFKKKKKADEQNSADLARRK